jgi:1,2-diacylglycerol 3-alpha-glucosyltransferase
MPPVNDWLVELRRVEEVSMDPKPVVGMVIDPWHHPYNGTVVSTRRFVQALSDRFSFRILMVQEADTPLQENHVGFSALRIPGINRILDRMKAPLALPNRAKLKQVVSECDLLHVQFPFFLGHSVISEAQRQGKPVVASFHVQPENILNNLNLSSVRLTKLLYRFFIRRFYNRVDCVIAPSQFAADLLAKAGLQKPVVVLSNGVTQNFFCEHTRQKSASPYHLVSVGRLAQEKQQHQLIEAIAASRFKSDITLSLVGTGPLQARLEALAKRLGVQATIGRVSDDVLQSLYQSADLFVHTSAVELEGMSVLEAMAAGCPVLVNQACTSAVPDFVTAPEATYRMNDVQDLTEKLDAMLDSPELRQTAAQENRQIAKARHHNQSVMELEQIYRQVLGGG